MAQCSKDVKKMVIILFCYMYLNLVDFFFLELENNSLLDHIKNKLSVIGLKILGRVGTFCFFTGKNTILCILEGNFAFQNA